MKRSVAAVLAVVLVGIGVGLAAILVHRDERVAGSSNAPAIAFIGDIQPGSDLCVTGRRVPAGTAVLRTVIGTYGRPSARLSAELTGAGRAVAQAPAAERRNGVTDFVLEPEVRAERRNVRVCISNASPARVALAGLPSQDPKLPGTPAFSWYVAGERSGASLVPKVIDRGGAARGGGSAWFVVACLILLGAGVGALAWVARGVRE
ncbi:unannotated protein [freshwater metagenome]|uniref:Unannotated protein n=1 Tax=freshwater metagenome TaxID=449393 RepID=A0A6J7E5D7_9ZZZZ